MENNHQTRTLFRNAAGNALLLGEVVRVSANRAFTRAQADAPGGVQGIVGVATLGAGINYPVDIASSGSALVLLEAGLTPVAGEPLYVSATVAGRATNVAPVSNAVQIGTITDTTGYDSDSRVRAQVLSPQAAASGSDSFTISGGARVVIISELNQFYQLVSIGLPIDVVDDEQPTPNQGVLVPAGTLTALKWSLRVNDGNFLNLVVTILKNGVIEDSVTIPELDSGGTDRAFDTLVPDPPITFNGTTDLLLVQVTGQTVGDEETNYELHHYSVARFAAA